MPIKWYYKAKHQETWSTVPQSQNFVSNSKGETNSLKVSYKNPNVHKKATIQARQFVHEVEYSNLFFSLFRLL